MNSPIHKSPFKFLDSFSAGDNELFFGRENEIDEIYDKVFQSQLLLVYGASGTGKSSIINCGLANKFEDSDWMPIHIRRGGNIRKSLFNQIQKEALIKVDLSEHEKATNAGLEKALNSVFLDHFKPIYLIFDQFEELFIFGFKDEWKDFISAIQFLKNRDLEVHFIFVIRGEYLEFLSEFEDAIPEFFDNRVRIEKMTRKNAVRTISGPTDVFSIQVEDGFEESLLKKISPKNAEIELTFLQVFLDKIYKNATTKKTEDNALYFSKAEIEKVGQIEDVLAEFVDEQLFLMSDSKAALTILKSFVSLQGTKTQMSLSDIQKHTKDLGNHIDEGLAESIVIEFVNKRILKEKDENEKYELRHDSLAQKIYEKITIQERELLDVKQFLSNSYQEFLKRGTLLNDEDLNYITLHERNFNIDAAQKDFLEKSKKKSSKRRKQQKRNTVIFILIVTLLISSIFGFFYSQEQKELAEKMASKAFSESKEAERQKELAITQELEAKKQSKLANQQKMKAEIASNEAIQQRNLAEKQRNLAKKEKEIAENARKRAVLSEMKAIEQQRLANDQRKVALRYRMLSLSREMAIKSTHMINPQLKGLLALQAYEFNKRHNGPLFHPEIYLALYSAQKSLMYANDNLSLPHTQVIKSMVSYNNSLYVASAGGNITVTNWESESAFTKEIIKTDMALEAMDVSGELMCIGGHHGHLTLYDLNTKSEIFNHQLSNSKVSWVHASEHKVVAVSTDGIIHFIHPKTMEVDSISIKDSINAATFSDKNTWVSTVHGQLIRINDAKQIDFFQEIRLTDEVSAIEIDAQNSLAFIGQKNGTISIYNYSKNLTVQVLPGHSAAITDLEFDPRKGFLISSSFDRSVRLWFIDEMQDPPIVIQDNNSWVSAITFDKNDEYFYAGLFDGSIKKYAQSNQLMTSDFCQLIGRNLTSDEWEEYIADDILYETTCDYE
ncbi:MAG: hypothetical protein JXR07_13240 [Reichenbachiella sp.]